MKKLIYFMVILNLTALACRLSTAPLTSPPTFSPDPIPPEFQTTYDDLNSSLDSYIASASQTGGQPPIFAAELATANGNAGENLLRAEILPLVRKELDALQDIGIQGVVVAIKFPLLEPDFSKSTEFLQFFKQVASEIRQRDMKFLVEVGPVFSGTIYSPLQVDWSKYTKESFLAAQQDELVTIASEIQPDYLQIANEPTTINALTGINLTPEEFFGFIQSTVHLIGDAKGIMLGAGSGTWEDPAFMQNLLAVDGLDCINIHIFPIGRNGNLLKVSLEIAQQARSAGKCAVISQSGLYKIHSSELVTLGSNWAEIYRRDAYSFFEPLDEKFIEALTLISKAGGIEFLSIFWTRNFFTYLDYAEARDLSDIQANRAMNQAFFAALQSGELSPLGEFYKHWINQNMQ